MNLPQRDGDGYLQDMDQWTPEIGKAMAEADGFEMTDEKWEQVLKAREFYDENQDRSADPQTRRLCRQAQQGNVRPLADRTDEADHQIWRPAQADRLRLRTVVRRVRNPARQNTGTPAASLIAERTNRIDALVFVGRDAAVEMFRLREIGSGVPVNPSRMNFDRVK